MYHIIVAGLWVFISFLTSEIISKWDIPTLPKTYTKRLRIQLFWLWFVFPILIIFLGFLDLCSILLEQKNEYLTKLYIQDLFNVKRKKYKNNGK